jgi:hypothetical protein
MGRRVVANDLSPYAAILTRAKLFPFDSVQEALDELEIVARRAQRLLPGIDLRSVPLWVRRFFHPATLREILAWSHVLKARRSYFLMGCLLGILHHQRPGFLSYPSSHTVPYLRERKFPRDIYPELYGYRSVKERMQRKVLRALKGASGLDGKIHREVHTMDAGKFAPKAKVHAVITSPPYMGELDYARDNRLRMWLVGVPDWTPLDHILSPSECDFFRLIETCLRLWLKVLPAKGICALVLGDSLSRVFRLPLSEAVQAIATSNVSGYSLAWKHREPIPNERRVRRSCRGSITETILVLRKNGRH